MSEKYVMKINMAMSNKPLFVQITDPTMSLDTIMQEAVKSLKDSKPLESQQLEQLYKTHQIFNNGKVQLKGALFKELEIHEQAVGSHAVKVAELDLIASHSGGSISLGCNGSIDCTGECVDCKDDKKEINCYQCQHNPDNGLGNNLKCYWVPKHKEICDVCKTHLPKSKLQNQTQYRTRKKDEIKMTLKYIRYVCADCKQKPWIVQDRFSNDPKKTINLLEME